MKLKALWFIKNGMIVVLLLAPVQLGSGQVAPAEDSMRVAVKAVLDLQVSAWNHGDVEEFMKGYWNSPELTFAGSAGITRGCQPVFHRYRQRYPDRQAMGQLDFSEIEVHPLGRDAVFVLGRWHLKRDAGELGGVFTLVFQQFPQGWQIIHDHTSLDAKTP